MCLLFEFNAYLAHTYSLFVYGWKLHHAVAPIAWGMKEHVPTLLTSYRYRIDIAISRYYRIEPEILNIESSLMNKGCQQLTITTWRPDNDSEHGVPLVVDSVPHFPVLRCHSSDSRVPSSLQYQQPRRLLTATTLHQIPTRASIGARAHVCVCVCVWARQGSAAQVTLRFIGFDSLLHAFQRRRSRLLPRRCVIAVKR